MPATMATELERALARRNAPALTDLGGGLLLASARAASEPALLRRHGVTHVLNVADDVPRVVGDDVQYCCLGMGDFGSDPRALPRVMGSALAFVQPALAAGGVVLVHCANGSNRSPTIAMALLMALHSWPLATAYEHVSSRRRVQPLADNRRALCEYEIATRGVATAYEGAGGTLCPRSELRAAPTDAAPPAGAAPATDAAPSDVSSDEVEKTLASVLAAIGERSDCYHWARGAGLYVPREALYAALDAGTPPTIIVDTRDDDACGGHITGALHMADGDFGPRQVLELMARARELAAARGAEVMICFHCMESARRGPRCAKRLVEGMRALRGVGYAPQPVKVAVLEGGFDQWVRRHWRDPARVEGYDDAYWGYAEDEGDGGASAPAHPLYERPAGQQATPWSDAG